MPAITLHPPSAQRTAAFPGSSNPLPQLLQTPSGLALLELQGTINMPTPELSDPSDLPPHSLQHAQETPIGRLIFPDYLPDQPAEDTAWMKRVYLYVGMHQRLTGEVKKLPKPMALIQKKKRIGGEELAGGTELETEELEVMEIVKWKILFSQRPEPVGG